MRCLFSPANLDITIHPAYRPLQPSPVLPVSSNRALLSSRRLSDVPGSFYEFSYPHIPDPCNGIDNGTNGAGTRTCCCIRCSQCGFLPSSYSPTRLCLSDSALLSPPCGHLSSFSFPYFFSVGVHMPSHMFNTRSLSSAAATFFHPFMPERVIILLWSCVMLAGEL